MNVKAAKRLARNMMIQHGLAHWRLAFMNHGTIAAQTTHSTHTISLAVEYTQAYSPDQLTQLMLHEIAHALRGPATHSHDTKWLQTARRLGYLHGATLPAHYPTPHIRWNLTCPASGELIQTTTEPEDDPFCKVCNDPECIPTISRRQIVLADTHNIQPPEHVAAPAIRRLKDLFKIPARRS